VSFAEIFLHHRLLIVPIVDRGQVTGIVTRAGLSTPSPGVSPRRARDGRALPSRRPIPTASVGAVKAVATRPGSAARRTEGDRSRTRR